MTETTVWVGKQGLNKAVIEEIQQQFKKRKLIKVKLLPACGTGKEKKELARKIAQKTGSTLVSQVGGAITLKKGKNLK